MASTLSFALLILLSSFSRASSHYVLPERYFINCGSNSAINFTNQTFVGDFNTSTFSLSGGLVAAKNNNPATDTPPIYQTARVFTKKSWYELEADKKNTFVIIRLHFSRFSTPGFNFSNSKVHVSALGFTLLSGFSIGNETVIQEFILPIHSKRKFRIEFTPIARSSPAAFVNAIEAFTTPADLFTTGTSFPRISPTGRLGNMKKLTGDYGFYPIHRVKIGVETTSVDGDTLRRTWTDDRSFILRNDSPSNVRRINYHDIQPAEKLSINLKNVTWIFNVKKGKVYLVRAHFCDDIRSRALVGPQYAFNFFVYSHYKEKIQPLQAPFYVDLVVESIHLNSVNVSIGGIHGDYQPVFLDGVEVMELLKHSSVRVLDLAYMIKYSNGSIKLNTLACKPRSIH